MARGGLTPHPVQQVQRCRETQGRHHPQSWGLAPRCSLLKLGRASGATAELWGCTAAVPSLFLTSHTPFTRFLPRFCAKIKYKKPQLRVSSRDQTCDQTLSCYYLWAVTSKNTSTKKVLKAPIPFEIR